jgi:lipid-binding SYLF domain-containing protein
MNRNVLIALGVAAFAATSAGALPPPPAQTLRSADDVLADFAAIPLKGIPPAILADAQGVVIIPRLVKAGVVFGGRGGHGVVLTRGPDGAWGGPTFVTLLGASFGLQAGVESADVVLVFRKRESLDRLLAGKGKLTLGADVAVAAGPVGRQAEAGTDATLSAEIFSYSRSRGLFAGAALNGAAIWYDRKANAEYAADKRPEKVRLTAALLTRLAQMSTALPPPPPATAPPGPTVPPAVVVPPATKEPPVAVPPATPPPPVNLPGRP